MAKCPMTRATGMGPLPELLEARAGAKIVGKVFAAEGVPLAVISDRRQKLPLPSLAGLFQRAARQTADPCFGLAVGLAMAPGEYGLWAQYATQAPTLGDVIARVVQTLHLHQTGSTMRIAPRPGGLTAWEYWHPGAPSDLFMAHTDHVIPVMIRVVQGYLGPDWRPTRIEVGYPAPLHAAVMEDATGAPWVFGRTCQAIVMPVSALSAARPRPWEPEQDGPLVSYADVVAEAARAGYDAPNSDIASTIALRLLHGKADIDGAARLLGTGRRKIQRRLAAEGLTYRSLVTDLRMKRAKSLIEGTDVPIKRIASELGYGDPAHFARAFGKHFGHAPTHLRGKTAGS